MTALTVGGWCTLLMCQGSAQENRSAGVCNTLVHNWVLGEQEKEHFICHNKTHQFSSRWYLRAQKSPYMLHSISQRLPQCCLWKGSDICLIYNGPIVKPITHWVIRHKHGSYIIGWGCVPVWTIQWGPPSGGVGGGGGVSELQTQPGGHETGFTLIWSVEIPFFIITFGLWWSFHNLTSEMQLFMCWTEASKRYG